MPFLGALMSVSTDWISLRSRFALRYSRYADGIPAGLSLSMSSALSGFKPGGMPLKTTFGSMRSTDDIDRALRFLIRLAPAMMHRHYLVGRKRRSGRTPRAFDHDSLPALRAAWPPGRL